MRAQVLSIVAVANHPFTPLRHRDVRLLWSAAVISDIGTWVQLIVVGSLVAGTTGSAVQTGLVALATFMPQGIASPIGGLLADRFDRRKVFAAALLVQALVTTGLAVALAFGVESAGVLTAFILLASAAGATGAPSYSAMQPDLVPPHELMAMISLGVYSWNGGRIVGPLLGAALALAVGPAWTVAFNALTFVVMAGAVTLLRRPFVPKGDGGGTVRERMLGGLRTMRTTPAIANGVLLVVLLNLVAIPFMGLMPIYAKALFDGGTGLAGSLATAQGIGAILGGIAATMLGPRLSRSSLVVVIMCGVALSLTGFALAPTVPLAIVAVMPLGASVAASFVVIPAVIQRDAPPESRGRVMSIMQASMGLSYGVGLLFIGSIGDAQNLRVAYSMGAILLLAGFAVIARVLPGWRAALDGEPAPVTTDGDVSLAVGQ